MKAWIRKTAAGKVPPSPVPHRPWQESVDDFDLHLSDLVDQESEEAVVDLWLEDPMSFKEGLAPVPGENSPMASPVVRRVKTGGVGLRRFDPGAAKIASTSSWDQEFADAKAHAAAVLKNLGSD